MSRFGRIGLILGLLWAHGVASAGEDLPLSTEPSTKLTNDTNSEKTERVLLLYNGKVVKGHIQATPQGYVVNLPAGRLVLTPDQVRLEADDIEDAYRQQRQELPGDSAEAHIELARWCVTNNLPDRARAELRAALNLEPTSRVAQNMLQRVTDQQLKTKDLPAVAIRDGKVSLLGNVKPLTTVDALGGLPREAALEFVSKVQPLLVNRCATAGCHGPGFGSSFELQRVKVGKSASKAQSEKNLTAVLERVDRNQPQDSPLLIKLRASTTAGVRQAHGSLTADQHQLLRRWIESIASPPPPTATKSKPELLTDDEEPQPLTKSESEPPAKTIRKPNKPSREATSEPREPAAPMIEGQTEPPAR